MPAAIPVIDWAAKPEPWRTIGPAFREICEAIAAGETPPPAPRPSRKLLLAAAKEVSSPELA